jgi:hypothetical protein
MTSLETILTWHSYVWRVFPPAASLSVEQKDPGQRLAALRTCDGAKK